MRVYVKQTTILLAVCVALYVLSFFVVVIAPWGVLDYQDWDVCIGVINIYDPIFELGHEYQPVRETLWNFFTAIGKQDNYARLYAGNELYKVDMYAERIFH